MNWGGTHVIEFESGGSHYVKVNSVWMVNQNIMRVEGGIDDESHINDYYKTSINKLSETRKTHMC